MTKPTKTEFRLMNDDSYRGEFAINTLGLTILQIEKAARSEADKIDALATHLEYYRNGQWLFYCEV